MSYRHESAFIDVETLRAELFRDEKIAAAICRSFGLRAGTSGAALEAAMFTSLGQAERDPELHPADANGVFRAACRAIGSNSRRWASFCAIEAQLRNVLGDYDPAFVVAQDRTRTIALLKQLLGGLTSTRDARSIVDWADRLAGPVDEYKRLLEIRKAALSAGSMLSPPPSGPELTAIVAAAIGAPSSRIEGRWGPGVKAPGMGPILASEFLRNLGWSGFKPDRHVQRLLSGWFGKDQASRRRGEQLAGLLGLGGPQLPDFMTYSVLGAVRCPPDESVNRVDQLVWLYGSFVKKKDRQPRTHPGIGAPRESG